MYKLEYISFTMDDAPEFKKIKSITSSLTVIWGYNNHRFVC
jgi:hypothetical protein